MRRLGCQGVCLLGEGVYPLWGYLGEVGVEILDLYQPMILQEKKMKKFKSDSFHLRMIQFQIVCLFVLMSQSTIFQSYHFLGINLYSGELVCHAQGHNLEAASGHQTQDLLIRSKMLYHYTTEPPPSPNVTLFYIRGQNL